MEANGINVSYVTQFMWLNLLTYDFFFILEKKDKVKINLIEEINNKIFDFLL